MVNPEIFGYISGVMGSLSILPQIHKCYVSGSSKDLSTKMFIIQYIAYTLAIIYGILIKHIAIYVMNAIGFMLFVILHGVKIYNEHYSLVPNTNNDEVYRLPLQRSSNTPYIELNVTNEAV